MRNIDLTVPAGSTLGVVGATGSGKSTLLSLLGRLRNAIRAVFCWMASICARSTARVCVARLSGATGTLLFSMAMRDNIALGLTELADERIQLAARSARLITI